MLCLDSKCETFFSEMWIFSDIDLAMVTMHFNTMTDKLSEATRFYLWISELRTASPASTA